MTDKIRFEDFEIVPIKIGDAGHKQYAVNFRGNTFVITGDLEVAQNCLDCQLKNELRYEQIRDDAASKAAEHNPEITS